MYMHVNVVYNFYIKNSWIVKNMCRNESIEYNNIQSKRKAKKIKLNC